jgi:hypothetical protein
MSHPTTMQQLLPPLREAARSGNTALVRQMLAWGDRQVDAAYAPNLLVRPHHYLLKWRAKRAWHRIARDTAELMRAGRARDLAALLRPEQAALGPARQAVVAEAMQRTWEHQRQAWGE